MLGKTISHYKILEKLGEGGMGVVYKAEDTKLKRTVALKFLPKEMTQNQEAKDRFIHEARAASALDHPNICTIYEINETKSAPKEPGDGQMFIAMACYEGETLKEKIEKGAIDKEEAINIAIQIAQGLSKAHKRGIIHRDIKPANIMITEDGVAKILDFGLVKLAGQTKLTKTGTTLGTIAYMSPEQARGEEVDFRTDIWSLAVVLYEMLSGRLPFEGDYDQAVIYSIIHEEPQPVTNLCSGLPKELERLINKALSKKTEERYRNADEISTELYKLANQLGYAVPKLGIAEEQKLPFIKKLFYKRVPQVLGCYLIFIWLMDKLFNWLVNQFLLSPNLVNFSIVLLVSLLPAVALISYFHGGPSRIRWKRFEKVFVSMNFVVTAMLLLMIFYSRGLGSVMETVIVNDEQGNKIERLVPKAEYIKSLALFPFENTTNDSSLDWLQMGINILIDTELDQDPFVFTQDGYGNNVNKIKAAGFANGSKLPLTYQKKITRDMHLKNFITGSFSLKNNDYNIKTLLYKTKDGKLIAERNFAGTSIFELIDEISRQIRYDLKIPVRHIEKVEDLPVSERLTNSLNALKLFTLGFFAYWFNNSIEYAINSLNKALNQDPTFVSAYELLAQIYYAANKEGLAKKTLQQGKNHTYKLSEAGRLEFNAMFFEYTNQVDKMIAALKRKVDLYPDIEGHIELAYKYAIKREPKNAIAEFEAVLKLDPQKYDCLAAIGNEYLYMDNNKEALKIYKEYARYLPNDFKSFLNLGLTYRAMGELIKAKSYFEKAEVLAPENGIISRRLADIHIKLGEFDQALNRLQKSLQNNKIPEDQLWLVGQLMLYYDIRGQMKKVIQTIPSYLKAWEKTVYFAPLGTLQIKLENIYYYMRAGLNDTAFKIIQEVEKKLSPPNKKRAAVGYLSYYLGIEDADNAEKQIKEIESLMQNPQAQYLKQYVFLGNGKINEIRGNYEQAILHYQKQIDFQPAVGLVHIAYRGIGRSYRILGKLKQAEETLQKSLKKSPYAPGSNYEIALVYWDMGKKQKALEHLKRTLYVWEKADPEFKPALKAKEQLAEWTGEG